MRPRFLLLLLGPFSTIQLTAADTFDEAVKRANGNYQQQIQQATQDLLHTRERLDAEKAPLINARKAAEEHLLAVEREVMRLEAQEQTAGERRRKMLKDQDGLRKTTNYLNSLSRDTLKAFEDGLAPGENQALAEQLQALQQSLDEAAGGTTARPAGAVLEFLSGWTQRATGGYAVSGKAVLAGDNQVRPGTLAFVGPEAFFLPNDGGAGTVLRRQNGATYPTGYAVPAWTRADAEALFHGQAGHFPADASRGKALHLQETRGSVVSHIRSGGIVAYIILATGLLALLLIVQKLYDLAQMKLDRPAKVQALLDAVTAGDLAGAERQLAGLHRTTHELFAAGLRYCHQPKALLEEQLQSLLHRQQMHFERRLSLLAVIATAAPLMGLLGTVSGMVKTFALMTVFGSGNAMKLSAGISEVLVATELGLMVAIPSLVVHGFLSHRIRKNLSLLEHYAMEFVIALDQSRAGTPPAAQPAGHESAR